MLFDKLLARHGLTAPDGRPLYAYGFGDKGTATLSQWLSDRIHQNLLGGSVPAAFVLWASEHIRREFRGGPITWEFVFDGLGMPANRSLAVSLVTDGLSWWGRSVRESDAGHLYLFTLMAEGGFPNALLAQATNYRRVIVNLVSEVERAGPSIDDGVIMTVARRYVGTLPQAFQNADGALLLADLAGSLVALRRSVPADVPMDAADRWLDQNRPEWQRDLPLRLSDEAADALVRGLLRAEREAASPTSGPLAERELRRASGGRWTSWVRLSERGFVSKHLLVTAVGQRLRLLPIGGDGRVATVAYAATPEDGGWEVQRLGMRGDVLVPLPIQSILSFGAYADGRSCGELQAAPGLFLDSNDFCFWKAGEGSDPDAPERLVMISGSARTRQPAMWLLAGSGLQVEALDSRVTVGPDELCEENVLRKIEGVGVLRIGREHIRIQTSAEVEAPQAALSVTGTVLDQWRILNDGGLVVLGDAVFFGTREGGPVRRLQSAEIELRPGRSGRYGERICTWKSGEDVLARLRFCVLASGVKLNLRELRQGAIELSVKGLPPGLHLKLSAAGHEKTIHLDGAPITLELEVPGSPPGEVQLSLWNAQSGATLTLKAAWPARAGILLDPHGRRLAVNQPIAVDELRGWRAVVPQRGDLQVSLVGSGLRVALAVSGEVPLVAHLRLIRALLAQGGPDAQVNLRLIVDGQEGHRLELRRYHDESVVDAGQAHFGLRRDAPQQAVTVFREALLRPKSTLVVSAVDLEDPERRIEAEVGGSASFDLEDKLPPGGGPWLVQARLDGRAQRALVWRQGLVVQSSREERVARYATMWRDLLASPGSSEWDRAWSLIQVAARLGDAGVLDQVQALARVPGAAAALLLRVPATEKQAVLDLEFSAPIFWPTIPIAAMVEALDCELTRQSDRYTPVLEGQEARTYSEQAVARSIGEIVRLRSDLAGHFAISLVANTMQPFCLQGDRLVPLKVQDPDAALREAANASVCRFDRLPNGVQGLQSSRHHLSLAFNPHAQPVIDAPLVAADVVLGLRVPLKPTDLLKLINLRLVDPVYFDTALPLAIQIGASRCVHNFKKPSGGSPSAPLPASSPRAGSNRLG